MPFKSEKQRRFLYAKHPKIAREFAAKEKKMAYSPVAALAAKTKKKNKDDDEEKNRARTYSEAAKRKLRASSYSQSNGSYE